MRYLQASSSSDIAFTRCSQFDLLTPNDLWPTPKQSRLLVLNVIHLHTKYEICPSFPSWDIVFTRFSQFDPCWPPNDLWPPPKTIGFLYSMWYTYIPIMRFVQASLLEISCLQGFQNLTLLTPNDLWPTPNTIGFLYSMWYTYIPNMRFVQAVQETKDVLLIFPWERIRNQIYDWKQRAELP